jgi:hypothetical protein
LKQYDLHRTIETIPIYQYYKLFDTGDLRYLIVTDNIHQLPKEADKNELEKALKELISTIKFIDGTIQQKQIKLLKSYLNWKGDKSKADKYNRLFDSYLHYLKDSYVNFELKGEKIDLLNYFKELKKDELYLDKRIFDIMILNYESGHEYNLFKELAYLNKAGFQVDINKDSQAYYLAIIEVLKDNAKSNTKT